MLRLQHSLHAHYALLLSGPGVTEHIPEALEYETRSFLEDFRDFPNHLEDIFTSTSPLSLPICYQSSDYSSLIREIEVAGLSEKEFTRTFRLHANFIFEREQLRRDNPMYQLDIPSKVHRVMSFVQQHTNGMVCAMNYPRLDNFLDWHQQTKFANNLHLMKYLAMYPLIKKVEEASWFCTMLASDLEVLDKWTIDDNSIAESDVLPKGFQDSSIMAVLTEFWEIHSNLLDKVPLPHSTEDEQGQVNNIQQIVIDVDRLYVLFAQVLCLGLESSDEFIKTQTTSFLRSV